MEDLFLNLFSSKDFISCLVWTSCNYDLPSWVRNIEVNIGDGIPGGSYLRGNVSYRPTVYWNLSCSLKYMQTSRPSSASKRPSLLGCFQIACESLLPSTSRAVERIEVAVIHYLERVIHITPIQLFVGFHYLWQYFQLKPLGQFKCYSSKLQHPEMAVVFIVQYMFKPYINPHNFSSHISTVTSCVIYHGHAGAEFFFQ